MTHELRRTKEKLRILTETPYVQWVLGDMADLVSEWELGDLDKIALMRQLKNRYEEFIRNNEFPLPIQGKLAI